MLTVEEWLLWCHRKPVFV